MTPEHQVASTKKGEGASAKTRKPYQKPSFRHEKVFETTALACGKISPSQLQCGPVSKS